MNAQAETQHGYGKYFLASSIAMAVVRMFVQYHYAPLSLVDLTLVMIVAGIADFAPLYFLALWIAELVRKHGGIDRPENVVDRAELARLMREREAMPAFVATDAAAVAAAQRGADAAARARKAECGEGDPKQRGRNCRAYEATENEANSKLAMVAAAKAATDQATMLESKTGAIRARLGKAAPVGSVNPLADTLGRIFSLPADTAATAQQVAMVVVVELLIAFSLIAWELLAPSPAPAADDKPTEDEPPVLNAAPSSAPALPPPDASSVARFMLACLPRAAGEQVTRGAIYKRYLRWCDEQEPRVSPLSIPAFWEQFAPLCERVHIRMRERGGKVYCIDVKLAA